LTRARRAVADWRLGRVPDWQARSARIWPTGAFWPPRAFLDACAALAGTLGAKGDRILTDSFTPTPG
jgi:hypothetical protein